MEKKIENISEILLKAVSSKLNPPVGAKTLTWQFFNQMVGGLRPHEFSIVCGSTGIGKTTFLANLSWQLILTGTKQFVMSVETGAHDYAIRLLSVAGEQDFNAMESIDTQLVAAVTQKYQKELLGSNTHFSLYEDRVSVDQIKKDILHLVDLHGTQVVFIDNLNYLMEVKRAQDQVIEMDRVIHDLIVFVKTCPVHIVMIMHSRKPEGKAGDDFGRVENEFQIKGSSTAVQEAQNVFLLNRPKAETIKAGQREWSDRELKIAKMRRRGKYVGSEIIFGCKDSRYFEKGIYDVFGSYK